jgi:hypothetical protein
MAPIFCIAPAPFYTGPPVSWFVDDPVSIFAASKRIGQMLQATFEAKLMPDTKNT